MQRSDPPGSQYASRHGTSVIRGGLTAGLLAMGLVSICHAASIQIDATGASGAMAGTARLDFRITVLPSLGLWAHGAGVRVQGNSGVLTLQHSRAGAEDGHAPAGSSQLNPHGQVVDTVLRVDGPAGDLVTLASP